MDESLFHGNIVRSNRILYTASVFAKTNLIFLQEAGELFALKQHTSRREHLQSYLFFIVMDGSGTLQYESSTYKMEAGSCAFINCRKKYSHCSSAITPWQLKWVHFYGPTMDGIYEKYVKRGGQPYFKPNAGDVYAKLLQEIYDIANKDSDVRDMLIFEKLTSLLTLTMIESRRSDCFSPEVTSIESKLLEIKQYLDEHYAEKIKLDDLQVNFFINKYYLTRIFKDKFGTTINSYILQKRITEAKYQLRFTNQPIEEIAYACGIRDASYFDRVFKKVEGISPKEFRKLWSKL